MSLHDKYRGDGVRVFIDPDELEKWSEIKSWLFKLKPKAEQDKRLLLDQIEQAGMSLYGRQSVQIQSRYLGKKSARSITKCRLCGEPYPAVNGPICRGCQGQSPYEAAVSKDEADLFPVPPLQAVALHLAAGKTTLHDMTQIIPHFMKAPAITNGQEITAGDLTPPFPRLG